MSDEENKRIHEAMDIMNNRINELAAISTLAYTFLSQMEDEHEFFSSIFSIIDKWSLDHNMTAEDVEKWMLKKILFTDEVYKYMGEQ